MAAAAPATAAPAPAASSAPGGEAGGDAAVDYESWGFRTVQFGDGDSRYDLAFRQVTDVGVGGSVWDAALVLAKYLAQRSEFSDAQFSAHNPSPDAVKAGQAMAGFAPVTARAPTDAAAPAVAAASGAGAAAADVKSAAYASAAASASAASASASAPASGGAGQPRPLRVCELGAGIGVVGLVAAKRGAQVSITDLPSHVPLIRHNIDLNTFVAPAGDVAAARPQVVRGKAGDVTRWPVAHAVAGEAYAWGESVSGLTYAPYDLLVGSDLTYDPRFFAPLLHALELLMDANTVFLYAYERRTPKELEFFQKLKEKFTFHKVHNSRLDPTFQSEDIAIFRIQRRWDKPFEVPKPLAVTPPEPVWHKGVKPQHNAAQLSPVAADASSAPASGAVATAGK